MNIITGQRVSVTDQINLIQYKDKDFPVFVIDPDGISTRVPTVGISLKDAATMIGVDCAYLMSMVLEDSLLMETPVCNYISLVSESRVDDLTREGCLFIEFADLVDLVCEFIRYCSDINNRPLLDFLAWYATQGMYLSHLNYVEAMQEQLLDDYINEKRGAFPNNHAIAAEKPRLIQGWVYFVLDEKSMAIKIGFTAEKIQSRLSGIQTGNPNPLRMLKKIRGTMAKEKEIHARFSHLKKVGEWFDATPELFAFIEKCKEDSAN